MHANGFADWSGAPRGVPPSRPDGEGEGPPVPTPGEWAGVGRIPRAVTRIALIVELTSVAVDVVWTAN